MVRHLVEEGCAVDIADNLGETAYPRAGNRGSFALAAYIVEDGALQKPLHLIGREKRKDPLPGRGGMRGEASGM